MDGTPEALRLRHACESAGGRRLSRRTGPLRGISRILWIPRGNRRRWRGSGREGAPRAPRGHPDGFVDAEDGRLGSDPLPARGSGDGRSADRRAQRLRVRRRAGARPESRRGSVPDQAVPPVAGGPRHSRDAASARRVRPHLRVTRPRSSPVPRRRFCATSDIRYPISDIRRPTSDTHLSENARMPERLSRLHVPLTRVVAIAVAVGSAVLLVYWASRTARGLPEEYRGQTGGGLFLNLYLLTSSMSQLIERPRVRVTLLVMSVVCLGAAMYFIFAHRARDIHLPRG